MVLKLKIFIEISTLEEELSNYKYQDKYYSYLESYLNNENRLKRIVVPSTYGITNSSLSELVGQDLSKYSTRKMYLLMGGR